MARVSSEATMTKEKAAPNKKKAAPNKKKAPPNKKAASNKKKAVPSKKAASNKKKAAPTKKKASNKKATALPIVTDSVVLKNLSEILGKNVSTFETGFTATISSEIYDAMFREIFVEYQLCDQATEERPILHQRRGEGPDGGCSYITIDLGHIKEVACALGPAAHGCQQFIKYFKRCFIWRIVNILLML